MPSGGFVKTIVAYGHAVDIYAVDGEGLVAFTDEFPRLDVKGDTMADLMYNLEIALEVECELDAIWHSEGIIEKESEDEDA